MLFFHSFITCYCTLSKSNIYSSSIQVFAAPKSTASSVKICAICGKLVRCWLSQILQIAQIYSIRINHSIHHHSGIRGTKINSLIHENLCNPWEINILLALADFADCADLFNSNQSHLFIIIRVFVAPK